MLDEQLGRRLVLLDILLGNPRVAGRGVLQGALLEGTDDVNGEAVLNKVLTENNIAAKQRPSHVILRPTDGTVDHVADAGRRCHRRFERTQVHPNVNAFLIHNDRLPPVFH